MVYRSDSPHRLEKGVSVDETAFNQAMEDQRARGVRPEGVR